ncbi:MAG: hypothetical protein JWO38_1864 [Gemmataceae bacterium]|nr:hypothetical protein [Gemmataceae bacterium]
MVPCGDQGLVSPERFADGIVGQAEVMGIAQLGPELGNGPMAGKPPVPEPTEEIPGEVRPRECDREFGQGAEGVGVGSTRRVRAVDERADQFEGAADRQDPVKAVIANGQCPPTDRTVGSLDGQDLAGKNRPGGQRERMGFSSHQVGEGDTHILPERTCGG